MVAGNADQANYDSQCASSAWVLCSAYILSVGGMIYQSSLPGSYEFLLINFCIWLSPALVLILLRRVCVPVISYAAPVLAIFAARLYFAWQLHSLGINSMVPKGDWASWLAVVLGMLSVAILAVWLFIHIMVAVVGLIDRSR